MEFHNCEAAIIPIIVLFCFQQILIVNKMPSDEWQYVLYPFNAYEYHFPQNIDFMINIDFILQNIEYIELWSVLQTHSLF